MLWLGYAPTSAWGQTAANRGGDNGDSGLRFRAVVAEALRSSPRLRGARDAYDRASIQKGLAESRFNLKITPFFSTGADRLGSDSSSFGVGFEKLLPTGTTVRFNANSFGFGLGDSSFRDTGYTFRVSHPIIQGFGPTTTSQLVDARRIVESAERGYEEAQQRLVLEVAQAYFSIVRQLRLVEASDVALERAVRLKTASEARMKVGLATQLDVLRAELLRSQAEASLSDRGAAMADALDQLKLLMGRPMSSAIAISGADLDDFLEPVSPPAAPGSRDPESDPEGMSLLAVFDDPTVATSSTGSSDDPVRRLVGSALASRIDVREAKARVADAERAASVATWSLFPDLRLNASYTQRGLGTDLAATYQQLFGGWRIGLTSAYSLDRSNEMAAFNSASLSARAAERALFDLRERVAAEVRRARRAIVRAEEGMKIQTQAVDVSDRQLRLAQLRYERGLAGNFDVVDAESNFFEAQSALISARVERALAGLALDLAMGTLDPQEFIR